jgi:hypothetical protein
VFRILGMPVEMVRYPSHCSVEADHASIKCGTNSWHLETQAIKSG